MDRKQRVAWETETTSSEETLSHAAGKADLIFGAEEWTVLKAEIEACVAIEIEKRTIHIKSDIATVSEDGKVEEEAMDPEEDKGIWNLNAMSVATWKSSCWPKGQKWNHEQEHFEPHVHRNHRVRSKTQMWIENNCCVLFFTLFPLIFVFLEMSILAGMLDQGDNLKTHIYGDGWFESPTWRYSGSAYLRVKFVPLLGANGTKIGMTSFTSAFGHNMLRDRPASEALQCLASDYLMPFNAYQVRGQSLHLCNN